MTSSDPTGKDIVCLKCCKVLDASWSCCVEQDVVVLPQYPAFVMIREEWDSHHLDEDVRCTGCGQTCLMELQWGSWLPDLPDCGCGGKWRMSSFPKHCVALLEERE